MEIKQSQTWQRHQLAATERMQAEVGRYTRPVMSLMSIGSLVYLMTWGPVWILGAENTTWLPLLVAALSACAMAIAAPAFALAVGIEGYFKRRLRQLNAENRTAPLG